MSNNKDEAGQKPVGIDRVLEMDRLEVLALLEGTDQVSSKQRGPPTGSLGAPRVPIRSMLDISEEKPSGGGTGSGQAPGSSKSGMPNPCPDASAPAQRSRNSSSSATNSPRSSTPRVHFAGSSPHPRSKSDGGPRPLELRQRGSAGRNDPLSEYRPSSFLSPSSGSQTQRSASQGGVCSSAGDVLRPGDFGIPTSRGSRGRPSRAFGGNRSQSPRHRLTNRSRSPLAGSMRRSSQSAFDSGDFSTAYRRLSDGNLALSSGSLSQLPLRQRAGGPGEGRLVKDYLGPDGEHLGSSDEEDEAVASDDEVRGRRKAPGALDPESMAESDGQRPRSHSHRQGKQDLTLLAASEDEGALVASAQTKHRYRSLLPEVEVTNAAGKTVKAGKNAIHPHTSYDAEPGWATPHAMDSDDEADMHDIQRAQRLSFKMTNVISTPEAHRSIRIIHRGEYDKVVQGVEEGPRKIRNYLVATDLSDESTHGLEWAIGTVLRDGDTLIAIYCVEEEAGLFTTDSGRVADDPRAMKEQAAAINSVASASSTSSQGLAVADFRRSSVFHLRGEVSGSAGTSPGPWSRDGRGRAEEERGRAVGDITDRVLRLLRKTKLQVRVIVEVIQCKNPKHLITEVIDLVDPTLVVIGSRGRSALKGVILGSFSNYLVTKSSVPVMVARKRLRKQSKYKGTVVRQVNNLSNPKAKGLASAKID